MVTKTQVSWLLPPANEVCEGYVFTRVCHSAHGGVSRPTPRGEVEGSGCGGGLQADTQVGRWGVWLGGVARPTPRWEVEGSGWGGLQAHTWGVQGPGRGGVSQHVLRQTAPPSRRLAFLFRNASIGGWKGGSQGTRPHRDSNSFIFMQFSAKNLQNNRLAHPLCELAALSGKTSIRHWHLIVMYSHYLLGADPGFSVQEGGGG